MFALQRRPASSLRSGRAEGQSSSEEVWRPLRDAAQSILRNETAAAPRSSFPLLRSRRSWFLYPIASGSPPSQVENAATSWLLIVEKRSAFTLADADCVWQLREEILEHIYDPLNNTFAKPAVVHPVSSLAAASSSSSAAATTGSSTGGSSGSRGIWTRAADQAIKDIRMLRKPPELLVVLHGGVADYKAAARLRVGGLDIWPMHRLSTLVRSGINDPLATELVAPTSLPPALSIASEAAHHPFAEAEAGAPPSSPPLARSTDLLSEAEQELAVLQRLLPREPQWNWNDIRPLAPNERFNLQAPYQLMGDQPKAVAAICAGVDKDRRFQTLLGATGTGKTFMMANVIAHAQRPTLVLAPNKVLAAQLYNELSAFFPKNAVEYFVSFYDFYLPESYSAASDTCKL